VALLLENDAVTGAVPGNEVLGADLLPPALLERFAADPVIEIASAEVTPYPGLWWVPIRGEPAGRELDAALERLAGAAGVIAAAPVLRYRECVLIPKNELLVTLDADAELAAAALRALRAEVDLEWLREFPGRRPLHLFRARVSAAAIFDRAREIAAIPGVVAAEPNFIQHRTLRAIPNDPLFGDQWHHRNIGQVGTAGADANTSDAWDVETGSDAITIAIIDEGIDVDHPDLAANVLPGHESTNQSSPSGIPGNAANADGHGTCCAGIAAAVGNNGIGVAGAAWDVSILPVRIGYGNHWTENAWIIDGLTWAVDQGADILSNSWGGGTPSVAEQNAIQYALSVGRGGLGCVVLFASGNSNGAVEYPAAYPETIAVGATSPCDERKTPSSCDGETWWGSNFGSQQSIVAPGVLIQTTDIAGSAGFVSGSYITNFNGTSAATPLVAGAAALALSIDPTRTAAEIRSLLEASAADQVGLPSQDVPGWDPHMGHGRLDVAALIGLLGGPAGPSSLVCTEGSAGTGSLAWTNGDLYDAVAVFDGATQIALLAGNATSHDAPGLLPGLHEISVRGIVAGQSTTGASCSLFILGAATDLVWSPAGGVVDGGEELALALADAGVTPVVVETLAPVIDLHDFARVWVNLGIFPGNAVLLEADAARLVDFLVAGGGGAFLYLEGGDTWFFDAATSLHPLFEIGAVSDGTSAGDLGTVAGAGSSPCALGGLTLSYTGENSWIDRLVPLGSAFTIQSNVSPAYSVAIFHDAGSYRTIGASFELGGFFDGTTTRADLVAAYLGCAGSAFVPPPTGLICIESAGSVSLFWTNPGGLDAIEIERDGALIATLAGSATSHVDSPVATGAHSYEVRGFAGGAASPPASCSAQVPPPPVAGLACVPSGGAAMLTWSLGGSYDSIVVRRGGTAIATLPGSATAFTDPAPPGGNRSYQVVPSAAGTSAAAASCTVPIPPDPVTGIVCTPIAGFIQVVWTDAESYGSIEVRRDGTLVATLGGSATSWLDPNALPGAHEYRVTPFIDGIAGPDAICSAALPPEAVVGLACTPGVAAATLAWSNGDAYDAVVVRRDGAVVATLAGSATGFADAPVPAGVRLYDVRGSVGGVPSEPRTCSASVLPPAPVSLSCTGGVGTASLAWSNPVGYSSIEVRRDGALIATLSGSATATVDPQAPAGAVGYAVRGVVSGIASPDATCSTTVALPPVASLDCPLFGDSVALSWSLGGATYDAVAVARDGATIATLAGSANSWIDAAPPGGSHVYTVTPSLGAISAAPAACARDVPPDAVVGLACALVDPCACEAELSWSAAEPYDLIEVRRDGLLVATLPGGDTSAIVPLAGSGPASLCVRPVNDGIPGPDACCSSSCPPLAADPIGALTCGVDDSTCTATVSWGANAAAASFEVRLDGVLVETLPGSATSAAVSLPGAGSATIEVSGANACGAPLAPSSCPVVCSPAAHFVRGDANADGGFNISDPITMLLHLFSGSPTTCLAAYDANDDEAVNIADVISSLDGIFGQGTAPPPPFPACGADPTAGPLGCDAFAACP